MLHEGRCALMHTLVSSVTAFGLDLYPKFTDQLLRAALVWSMDLEIGQTGLYHINKSSVLSELWIPNLKNGDLFKLNKNFEHVLCA